MVMLYVQSVELVLMSSDINNPTKIIKDGIIFALIGQAVAFVSKKASDYVKNREDYDYEEEEEDEQ